MSPPPAAAVRYGRHPDQVGDLHLPEEGSGPHACVVLIHGGFWRAPWDRTLMTPLAVDLARRGFAAWNIEYRRVGQEGGGWPGTLDDVGAALDVLADRIEIDASRLGAAGHSAGGQLALWLGARADGRCRVRASVSLGGVAGLAAAYEAGLGSGAVAAFLGGGPEDVPDRYALADPASLLPLGVRQLLVHGEDDEDVPAALSRAHVARARAAGDEAELVELVATNHFDVIDPSHEAWLTVIDRLPALLA